MKLATRSLLAALLGALTLGAASSALADGDRYWKRGHGHHKHWHRHGRDVVVIREPRYFYREPVVVVREPAVVYREPVYVYPRRPALTIGLDIPPLVIPF